MRLTRQEIRKINKIHVAAPQILFIYCLFLSNLFSNVKVWIVLPLQASKNYSNDTIREGSITF